MQNMMISRAQPGLTRRYSRSWIDTNLEHGGMSRPTLLNPRTFQRLHSIYVGPDLCQELLCEACNHCNITKKQFSHACHEGQMQM